MARKFLMPIVAVLLIMAMILPGCAQPGEEEPPPPYKPEKGAWIKEVVFSFNDQVGSVVSQLGAGALDMYAFPIADPSAYKSIQEHPEIDAELNYGSYREIRFNTYRTAVGDYTFKNGKFNPFGNPKIREAMNRLIDRNYIVDEILQKMGSPKWTALGTKFPDHARYYTDIIKPIETQYSYNFAAAKAVFDAQMPLMGANWNAAESKWYFKDSPVEIIMLIRSDLPPNPAQGQYVADQIAKLGFTVTRLLRTGTEAAPIWQTQSGVENGGFHVYTGGWSSPSIPRDGRTIFAQMYTEQVMALYLWQVLKDQLAEDGFAEFRQTCIDLRLGTYTSMEQRKAMFKKVLEDAMKFSNVVWTCDVAAANAYRYNVKTAVDVAGGIGDPAWVHCTHKIDPTTGEPVWAEQLRVAVPNMLVEPYNPVEGSAFTYDMFITRRALGDSGTIPDPRDGLYWPLRVKEATVEYNQNLPITKTLDWIKALTPSPSKIAVPDDAWYDWDATNGKWITAGEYKAANPTWDNTAQIKTVAIYPDDIFTVPLHDGSKLSLADFLMAMIVYYERGKSGSLIYDAAKATDLASFLKTHKGVRITSVNPLTIETYTDTWYMDAEWCVSTWFPTYGTYGWTGFWHMVSAGWLVEHFPRKSGFPTGVPRLAWSKAKSDSLGVERMDYTKGTTSLAALKGSVAWAKTNSFMPYYDIISGQYTKFGLTGLNAEITARWTNLEKFAETNGHYWVGNGPYYLKSVSPVAKIITLGKFEDYPDPAGRFFFFTKPK